MSGLLIDANNAQISFLTQELSEALKENARLREENARLARKYEEAKSLAKLAIRSGSSK